MAVLRFPLDTVRMAILLLCFLPLVGCTPSFLSSRRARPVSSSPALSSQKAMETGDYVRLRTENEEKLQQCRRESECETALFDLGLVYVSPHSPYRDRYKALEYFNALIERYPQSPWIFQARTWVALVNEQITLDLNQRQLQAGLDKARADLRRTKTNLRSRENAVRSLKDQLDRSQEIDVEMQEKERELLQGEAIPHTREN